MTVDDATSDLQRALDALTSTAPLEAPPPLPAAPAGGTAALSGDAIADAPTQQSTAAADVRLTGPLDEAWLELWYRPKIDLRQKCLAGAEAIARIRHPELGVLSPENYLPGADHDSLTRLMASALRKSLDDWSIFSESGFNLRLAINIPVKLLFDLPIIALVSERRPSAEHWPGLIVGVTEDQFVRDAKRLRDIADELRAAGVAVAIDDFGAGYSSFSAMRELTFAEIKINRSFVQQCTTDATNAAICQTAIDLAHRFGSTAVADGIENISDLQTLQIMGCDFGQGALLAPPMTKERFIELLRQRVSKPRVPRAVSLEDSEPSSSRLSA